MFLVFFVKSLEEYQKMLLSGIKFMLFIRFSVVELFGADTLTLLGDLPEKISSVKPDSGEESDTIGNY